MDSRGRILVLWNQTEEDIYERWRQDGPKPLAWDPLRTAPDVGTVQEELEAMLEALRQGGFDVRVVNVEDDIDRLMGAIRFHRPEAVFNLVEYFNDDSSQEPYVAGLYDLLGVPYTGCPPRCLSLCQDKYRTKVLLSAAGLPTAEFLRVTAEPVPDPEEYGLSYPLIVKPSLEDASGGIEAASVVHTFEQLQDRVRHVLKEYEQPMVVEEYIEGREIHAAVLGNRPPEVLPLFEMEFDDSEFNPEGEWRPQIISFKAKWDPHSQVFYSMDAVVPPQDLDEETEARIREVAVGAFRAMECRDYARVDMRVDEEEGEVYVLEVNPNPDLVDGAAYMQCATAGGRTFSETLCAIAAMAVERGRELERKLAEKEKEKAHLPSDYLLREYALRQRQEEEARLRGDPAPVAAAATAAPGTPPPAVEGARGEAAQPAPAEGEDADEAGGGEEDEDEEWEEDAEEDEDEEWEAEDEEDGEAEDEEDEEDEEDVEEDEDPEAAAEWEYDEEEEGEEAEDEEDGGESPGVDKATAGGAESARDDPADADWAASWTDGDEAADRPPANGHSACGARRRRR